MGEYLKGQQQKLQLQAHQNEDSRHKMTSSCNFKESWLSNKSPLKPSSALFSNTHTYWSSSSIKENLIKFILNDSNPHDNLSNEQVLLTNKTK